jgi:type IV pilus assembly protein PilX
MKPDKCSQYRHQQGAALVVGLVFLLVLTMIGVSAIQTSTQEERMTGYVLDSNASLQAAEAALREAETFVKGYTETTLGAAYYADPGTSPDPNIPADWKTANARTVSTLTFNANTISLLKSLPMYRIEKQPILPTEAGQPLTKEAFLITAYSTGGSGNAPIVLQTAYRRSIKE